MPTILVLDEESHAIALLIVVHVVLVAALRIEAVDDIVYMAAAIKCACQVNP